MSQEAGEAIITTSKAGERQGEKPSIERRSQEEMASAGSKADARVTGEASSSSRQPESTRVHSQNRTGTARAAASRTPPPARPLPSLTELCVSSLCDHDLAYCLSLEHVPDHLAADMMMRIMHKGRLSPALAYKFQSSTCEEVSAFATECIQRLHNAQIRAGPVTPKGYGCRF